MVIKVGVQDCNVNMPPGTNATMASRVNKLFNYRAVGAEEPQDTDLVAEVQV